MKTELPFRGHLAENRVLAFEWEKGSKRWLGTPFAPFRPMGLMIWGDVERAVVECQIRSEICIQAGFAPAPAEFFTTAKSFEDTQELLKAGKKLASWVAFPTVAIGCHVRLHISRDSVALTPDDKIRFCMWGTLYLPL